MGIFLPASPHVFCDHCTSRPLEPASGEVEDRHVHCNFVVIRYGVVETDLVRVSIIVCFSAHIMQKLFLIRPDNIVRKGRGGLLTWTYISPSGVQTGFGQVEPYVVDIAGHY